MLLFFIAYQALQIISLPFFLCFLIIRKIKGKTLFGSFKERIGLVPRAPRETIWLHAVSVGEVLSIQKIIDKIKDANPNAICYLTVGTQTGKAIAKAKLNADYISFLPHDFLPNMLFAYKRIKPKRLIVVEAEIWPNLIMLAHFKKIPCYLINARISARSKRKYYALKKILLPLFGLFTKIYTQSKDDAHEFEAWGVTPTKLCAMGNIKTYNVMQKIEGRENNRVEGEKTLLVGSMHPGELDVYLEMYAKLKQSHKTLKLFIAPRHFHWRNELIEKVERIGFSYELLDEAHTPNFDTDILLICKMGELFGLYKQATIYFLGGTFVPIGGHNLLEPAGWGIPTIVGPYNQNNHAITKELAKQDAIIEVANARELIEQTNMLLHNQQKRNQIAHDANTWITNESMQVQKILHAFISHM